MRIFVTDQHIAEGRATIACNPVALALREQLDRIASCTPYWCWIKGLNNEAKILNSEMVREWLDRFFGGALPDPFEFELPDELFANARPGTTLTESRHRV